MTYCVGVLLDDGLVMASDSRTNAGVDHVSSFRKMAVFERPGDRVVIISSAGNLSITQSVVNLLSEALDTGDVATDLHAVSTMFQAARIMGHMLRTVHSFDGPALKAHGMDFNASFLIGGQIQQEPPRLFQVYAEGNFIEATDDTPYFQIGETKYGKPVLDRIIDPSLGLEDAARCALVSYTSTIRSNVSVGLPIDLACYRRDALKLQPPWVIDIDNSYFQLLQKEWDEGLKAAFKSLTPVPYSV